MAWKEYSELKSEDKRHEDVRQKMIVCQSQVDRAVDIVNNVEAGEFHVVEDFTIEVTKVANQLVDWVYEKANEQDDKPTNISLPTPTAAQAKVLNKIAAELKQDVETIKSKVLDYAEKNYNIRKYPENVDSVSVFVKALQ